MQYARPQRTEPSLGSCAVQRTARIANAQTGTEGVWTSPGAYCARVVSAGLQNELVRTHSPAAALAEGPRASAGVACRTAEPVWANERDPLLDLGTDCRCGRVLLGNHVLAKSPDRSRDIAGAAARIGAVVGAARCGNGFQCRPLHALLGRGQLDVGIPLHELPSLGLDVVEADFGCLRAPSEQCSGGPSRH